ncbi:urea carboxylase-associated family protein [Novosphingobium flavum]|uniref:Urea carboxylase-associated family protein n=1 Tax=Novosphingobium flavum TaxID=1778672 RepID=A0A7X1FTV0_9SPHN|nr:urea amidolyase associated protein UAAP1 [Novosphingobium flavum]MBC2666863.1 urea carboxylase-associated family protein [Novosphingobium flavum]
MSETADPYGAQAHARAMAWTRVEAMPTLPATASDAPGPVVWEETIAPGGYAARRIARGTRLRLVDLHGDACASLLLFNAEMPTERLNVADTVKVQWNGYLGAGKILLSDMGRAMMSILSDTAGTHDTFCGASNEAANARKYGEGKNYGPHPNARDRFMLGAAKFGLGRKDVHPCINLFKGVKIAADGATLPEIGPFAPGREVVLRAEMELIAVLANCPHVLDPRPEWAVTALRATAWKDAVTAPDDALRLSTPETTRAFLNTEDYYAR